MTGTEQEMIEDYGIESSVWIGGKRIVLGINEGNKEKPRYMSCIVTDNGLFGRYEGTVNQNNVNDVIAAAIARKNQTGEKKQQS